jgi:hypothetical protein
MKKEFKIAKTVFNSLLGGKKKLLRRDSVLAELPSKNNTFTVIAISDRIFQ